MAIYFNHLVHTNGTAGAIGTAVYVINCAHNAAGFESPTDDPFVQLIKKGSEKICTKPSKKKDPITAPVIQQLIDICKPNFDPTPDLKTLRFLLLAVLCFAGFLRIEEALAAKLSDIQIHRDHMTIYLPKCKTRPNAGRQYHLYRKNRFSLLPRGTAGRILPFNQRAAVGKECLRDTSFD